MSSYLFIHPTNEFRGVYSRSQQMVGQAGSWSVGEMLCPNFTTVIKWYTCKRNLLHMAPMTCRCAWQNYCEAWPKDSRVIPLFLNPYTYIYPYFLWRRDFNLIRCIPVFITISNSSSEVWKYIKTFTLINNIVITDEWFMYV